VTELRRYIDENHAEFLRGNVAWAEGVMEEERGNFEAAIDAYRRKVEIDPTEFVVYRYIGRCFRKLGRFDEAIESLERVISVYPNRGPANYELAVIYREIGRPAKAIEHLERALERWKNADPDFEPAMDAKRLLADLSS
jgi:tetratricopeptide (TPR) repeat protein